MRKAFKQYVRWIGIWIGSGETQLGNPTRVRLEVKERLNGEALEVSVEYCHSETNDLLHGVVGLLGLSADGIIRYSAYSNLHGNILLEATPDDPGVLALSGNSPNKRFVSVTIVQDKDDHLMLTSHYHPLGAADDESKQRRTVVRLGRMKLASRG
ncbi:MAG: hypothetical protein HUU03_02180 [Planctomycetaceae bacterium]|nr:hypothetical protein [Planctomycetota bacterium]MCQ3950199.1 hypothetical protein [Planctomycetota bacterium]NUO15231.1 hypothetical protein [Planctomycetaceae bacterium]HRJ79269.1 hypothetical protein [Planctomycetota bacterium]